MASSSHDSTSKQPLHIKESQALKDKESFLLKTTFTFLGHLNSAFLSGKWSPSLPACASAFAVLVDLVASSFFFPDSFFALELYLYCFGDFGFLLMLWFFLFRVMKSLTQLFSLFSLFCSTAKSWDIVYKHLHGCEMERCLTNDVCLLFYLFLLHFT